MEATYRSDVYQAGRDEDGEAVYGEAFYAVVQLADGSRFAHSYTFQDTSWVDYEFDGADEDYGIGGGYVTNQAEAVAKVEALVAKINASGDINLNHWSPIDPEYGSSAYQQQEALGMMKDAWNDECRMAAERL